MRLIGVCLIVVVVMKTYANQTSCERYRNFMNISIVVTNDLDTTILQAFNVTNGKGVVRAQSPRAGAEQCEQMDVTVLKVPNDTVLGIYDQEIVDELDVGSKSFGFILGEEIEAVQAYTSQLGHYRLYMVTSPVGITTERRIEDAYARSERQSPTFVLWPSPTSYVNAVVGNVLLYTSHIKGIKVKVTLLFLAESEDAILYIDSLRDRLEDKGFYVMPYDLFVITTRMKRKTDYKVYFTEAEYVDTVVRPLRDKMKNHGTHLVLFYVDETLDMKIQVLEFLFSKGAQLERDGVPWIIADMLLVTQKTALHKLSELAVLKTELLVLEPCPGQDGTGEFTEYSEILHEGVAERGLMAGKAFMDALLGRAERSSPLQVLSERFSMGCSLESNITEEERTAEHLLKCPESPSIQRVGFPRYDFIWTVQLRPRSGNRVFLPAIYFHNDTRGNLPLVLRRMDESDETQVIHVGGDYIVMREKPRDISENVVLIKEAPFVMQNEGSIHFGMAIDIYNAVRRKLSEVGVILDLKLKEVDVYGSFQDGNWTGVFGELSDKQSRTVLGIGQISITDERLADETFVFSPVFAHTVVTYMIRKTSVYDAVLQFLRPFTLHVWLALFVVVLLSGVYFRLLDAWNPFKENTSEDSKFNLKESLWHSYLLITQIGAPFGAVNLPARVYSVIYWFFALVVVGCYTGNLAGFLTESRMLVPNLSELVNEKGYKFGMLTNSSVSTTYLNQIIGHSLSGERLDETRLELVDNYEQGVKKVKEENFILVGTSLVMQTYRDSDEECALSVGESKYYNRRIQALAFPMRADWPLADAFKQAMGRLKQTGELQLIYRKWISSNRKCQQESEDEDDHTRLGWDNFIGLYVLTALGIVLAYIFLAFKLGHLKLKEEKPKLEAAGQDEEEVIELIDTKA